MVADLSVTCVCVRAPEACAACNRFLVSGCKFPQIESRKKEGLQSSHLQFSSSPPLQISQEEEEESLSLPFLWSQNIQSTRATSLEWPQAGGGQHAQGSPGASGEPALLLELSCRSYQAAVEIKLGQKPERGRGEKLGFLIFDLHYLKGSRVIAFNETSLWGFITAGVRLMYGFTERCC